MTDGAVLFPFNMKSNSHRLSVFVRTSGATVSLDRLCQRSCGILSRFLGDSSFLELRWQRVSSSYRSTMWQENKPTVPTKPVCLRPMQAGSSSITQNSAQPAGNLHRPQILSGILESVAVALVVTVISPWMSPFNTISKTRYRRKFIRIAMKQPRIRKLISVVRRKRRLFQLIFNSLVFAAFSVFIAWDIRHLSHDQHIESEIQRTIREDPADALSIARKELARMLKKKKSRC